MEGKVPTDVAHWVKRMNDLWYEGVDKAETMKMYADLSSVYDQVFPPGGPIYRGPTRLVEKAREVMGHLKTGRLLDVAAGTGQIGHMLQREGFENLDALDGSPEMLEQARKKNVYRNVICSMVGSNRLPIEDDVYDGLLLTGALCYGSIEVDSFPELCRITKPGGILLFLSADELYADRIHAEVKTLQEKGHWKVIETPVIEKMWEHCKGFFFILEVTK